MNKRTLSLLIIFLCTSYFSMAQLEPAKQMYSSPKLKDEIQKQKTVAILPFDVGITYKRPPKNYDATANKNEEINTGKNLQQSMYTFMLRKSDKYIVAFQDVDRTNALLKSK